MPGPAPNHSHTENLHALTALLIECEDFWRVSPFTTPEPAWCARRPALAAACLALGDRERRDLEGDPAALQAFVARHLPALETLPDLLALPASAEAPVAGSARAAAGIPGRKWLQIQAFAAQVSVQPGPLLDWCSGKAHLGRLVAGQQQRAVHAVERDAALYTAGAALADRDGQTLHYQCADVLRDPVAVPAGAQILALHACGDLHRQLLRGNALDCARELLLAPCCYHLWLISDYTPLSAAARAVDLRLTRNQVQLAVQETVNAPERELRKQHQLAAWRLGFDSLQRQLRGVDSYLPTPSVPHRELARGFASLCQRLAAHKGLALPAEINWPHWEQQGQQRLLRAQRLQLVRQAFRRAIEMWLVRDLALALEERGFAVQLATFCPRSVSPRNLLLRATAKTT